MTGSRLLATLRDNAVDSTAHGFRSSYRDWCDETGMSRELAEFCYGHTVGCETRSSGLIEEWSAHGSA